MTPTLARQRAVEPRQRGYFDGLMGREGQLFYEWDSYAEYAAYNAGYALGAAALTPETVEVGL